MLEVVAADDPAEPLRESPAAHEVEEVRAIPDDVDFLDERNLAVGHVALPRHCPQLVGVEDVDHGCSVAVALRRYRMAPRADLDPRRVLANDGVEMAEAFHGRSSGGR